MTISESIKEIQLNVGAKVDGVVGPKTLKAICEKMGVEYASDMKSCIKNIQEEVGVVVDGVLGPKTYSAIISHLDARPKSSLDQLKDKYINKPVEITKVNYKTSLIRQADVRSGNSKFGKAGCENRLENVKVPEGYPMKYDGKTVKTIRIHELVADRLKAALEDIVKHYGEDLEKVAPGACNYSGSYNFRKTVGGGSTSIHSWGLAIDFDAENNTYAMKKPKARLSQEIYKPFWDILEAHGLMSLGRRGNYDWMHCQFTLWG